MKTLILTLALISSLAGTAWAGGDGNGEFGSDSAIQFPEIEITLTTMDNSGTTTLKNIFLGNSYAVNLQICTSYSGSTQIYWKVQDLNPILNLSESEVKNLSTAEANKKNYCLDRTIQFYSLRARTSDAYYFTNVKDKTFVASINSTVSLKGYASTSEFYQQLQNILQNVIGRYNLYISQVEQLAKYYNVETSSSRIDEFLSYHKIMNQKLFDSGYIYGINMGSGYLEKYYYTKDNLKLIGDAVPELQPMISKIPTNFEKYWKISDGAGIAAIYYELDRLVDLVSDAENYSPGSDQYNSDVTQINAIWCKYGYDKITFYENLITQDFVYKNYINNNCVVRKQK